MANTTALALCPKCHKELRSPKDQECPHCHHQIKAPENPLFATPDYISYQIEDQENEIKKLKGSREGEQRHYESRVAQEMYFDNCTDADRIAAMNDAYNVLKRLVVSKSKDKEAVSTITKLGKKIGQISEAIEKYALSGGSFHGPKILKPTAPASDLQSPDEAPGAGIIS